MNTIVKNQSEREQERAEQIKREKEEQRRKEEEAKKKQKRTKKINNKFNDQLTLNLVRVIYFIKTILFKKNKTGEPYAKFFKKS